MSSNPSESQNRLHALDFATRHAYSSDTSEEDVVRRATRYVAFLSATTLVANQEVLPDQKRLSPAED